LPATEVIKDSAVALPPLDVELARDLMQQTRLLEGYRDCPAADLEAIADTLVRLSQLVVDCPALRELDINPLIANEAGVIALDVRMRIEASELDVPAPNPRLAIRPYPNQWEARTETESGMRQGHAERLARHAPRTSPPVMPKKRMEISAPRSRRKTAR
jgi:acetyltransferase